MPSYTAADVTIVTVSYNSSPILTEMLKSVPKAAKVVIVNNGGQDTDKLEALTKEFDATLVTIEDNRGFGAGCNLGVEHATTEFVMLLNPDAQLQEGALEALLEASLHYGPNTAFGPRIENADGSADFKQRSVLLPREDWMPRGCPKEKCEVPVLTGSAIFAKRELFQREQFDQEIFMYHEDDDWSLRVRKYGSLVFVPESRVLHRSGHSSGRDPKITRFKAFHLAKSRIYAMRKHNRPNPRALTVMKGFLGLFSPANVFSARRRAKSLGFYEGARKSEKRYNSPEEMISFRSKLPLWKLKRELLRPMQQLQKLAPRVCSYFFAQPYYDLFLSRKKRVTQGTLPSQDKVAVYLIFPKEGLLESHNIALDYLIQEGYAPIVVSNVALTHQDRQTLISRTLQTIERPNFGYDFGGYRDGILAALDLDQTLERLVLVNDSSWFPLPGSKSWLKEAEALNLDFVGAATNYGHPRVGPEGFRSIVWSYSNTHKNFHYCSFGLLVSGALLEDEKFHRFWKTFPMTNDKTVTVRRGEIGLSTWVIKNGFSHGTTLDLSDLDERLSAFDRDTLRNILSDVIIPEAPRLAKLKKELLETEASKQDLIALILTVVAGQGVSYTLPSFMHASRGFAFLKKSPIWLNKEAADLTLAFARGLNGPLGQTIVKEAQAQIAQRAPAFGKEIIDK